MFNKKDQLLFVAKFCIICFALAIVAAYIYCVGTSKEMFRVEFIGQLLLMDAFMFVGGLFGLTDIVIRFRSAKTQVLFIAIILYALSLYLLTFVPFNPLTSIIKLVAYTFLFGCISLFVAESFTIWQKKRSDYYMKIIEQIQQKYMFNDDSI